MRERWIKIATVRTGTYIRRLQWGCPNGLMVLWQGRTHVFQPTEFLSSEWIVLLEYLAKRLRQARLEPVSAACSAKRDGLYFDLLVLVRRRRALTPRPSPIGWERENDRACPAEF